MRNLLALLLLLCFNCKAQTDIILFNGKIFTADRSLLWVDALAIKGDRILTVGSNDEVLKFLTPNTKLIDLQGKVVVPGFNDAHDHIGSAFPARRFSMMSMPTDPTPWSALKDSISRIVKEVPPGTFIITEINPDLLDSVQVRKKSLDEIAPNHPVMLSAWTGHGKILNTKALEFFGINNKSEFLGGRIEKNEKGEPNGLLEEYAGFGIGAEFSKKQTDVEIAVALQRNYNRAASLGITSVQNMGSQLTAEQTNRIYSSAQFACRVRVIAFPLTNANEFKISDWENFLQPLNKMNSISGVKMVLDGTPVERLACMTEAYHGRANKFGRLNFSADQLKNYMQWCLAHQQQIIIHAVGDSAIKTIFRTMRALQPDTFWRSKRLRIEHGEFAVTKPEDIATLKSLGIIVVQNPTHLGLPQVMAERFQPARRTYFQAMQTLVKNGIVLAFGSDGPNDPFLNLMLATLHPDNPKEALKMEEAVIAYTYGSAYAEFAENEKGTISAGKLADLAVLSQDIFIVKPEKIPETVSVLTMVGGKIVFQRE